MILAFESSCDETALAAFDAAKGMAGEWVHSQIALHAKHGGVVPDIATREHLRQFGPLLGLAAAEVGLGRVTRVAVTRGPGLAACLALGIASAKAAAAALKVPLLGVNHLRAHAWSPFIPVHAKDPAGFDAALEPLLPHLGLIVSGGNTLLFSLSKKRAVRVISSTLDDAAGEALDKGAKLLGLGYPGGPQIERLARAGRNNAFDFPRGVGRKANLDFSFSGVKTSLRYRLEKMAPHAVHSNLDDLCASYQQAVLDALVGKLSAAADKVPYSSLGLSGGVANNRLLRTLLESEARGRGLAFFAAEPRHTGDNAAMIGFAAWADREDHGRHGGFGLRPEPAAYL
jgi:N6-L-threonylcarbamoyladenine synthase